MAEIPEYVGVPDTDAIRDDLVNYASDDCPWNLIHAALDEIDRLRLVLAELHEATTATVSPSGE